MDNITITKDQLQAALQDWEQAYRDGKTQTPEQAAAMSVEEVASASADHLWAALVAPCIEVSPMETSEVRRAKL